MKGIDHVGIAVKDLDQAITNYCGLLNAELEHKEIVESQGVEVAFVKVGKQKVELLSPTHDDSPVAKFLNKRGEGIHHVAFKAKDILKSMERMKSEGYRLLQDKPITGANNKWVCFVHPKEANGVLIELCQKKKK